MIRNLIFYICFAPVSIFYAAVAAASTNFATWAGRGWSRTVIRLAGVVGVKVDVDLSALDPDTRYVFIANHQSQLDIPLLNAILEKRRVGFLAKESLFRIPLWGRAMTSAGHIGVNRSNPRLAMKSLDEAARKARAGAEVIVFAEGTRQVNLETLGEFKVGGMILALKTGMAVAPLVLNGTGDALPKHKALLRPAQVRVRALPPIPGGSYTLKQREQFKDDLFAMMNAAYLEARNG